LWQPATAADPEVIDPQSGSRAVGSSGASAELLASTEIALEATRPWQLTQGVPALVG
jgi:hypothetical protein